MFSKLSDLHSYNSPEYISVLVNTYARAGLNRYTLEMFLIWDKFSLISFPLDFFNLAKVFRSVVISEDGSV